MTEKSRNTYFLEVAQVLKLYNPFIYEFSPFSENIDLIYCQPKHLDKL